MGQNLRDILNRLLAVVVALPFVGAFFSIVYFAEYYRSKSVEAGQAIVVECGQRFECPRECWLLSSAGILYVIALVAILVAVCFILSRLFSGFSLRLWLLVILFGAFFTEASCIISFHEHKHDYFFIGNTAVEQKYGAFEWKAELNEIANVKKEGGGFVVYFVNRKPVRVSNSRISRLYDSEELSKELEELSQKTQQNGK